MAVTKALSVGRKLSHGQVDSEQAPDTVDS